MRSQPVATRGDETGFAATALEWRTESGRGCDHNRRSDTGRTARIRPLTPLDCVQATQTARAVDQAIAFCLLSAYGNLYSYIY